MRSGSFCFRTDPVTSEVEIHSQPQPILVVGLSFVKTRELCNQISGIGE